MKRGAGSNLVKARIGAHPWRRLHSPQGYSHQSIAPGWMTWFVFRFDDKQEFDGARTIDFELPLENDRGQRCTVRERMVRPETVPEDPASSVVHSKFGLWLAFGTGLAATGGLNRLGGANFGFELGFDFYPWLHHGFFLDLFVEWYQSFNPANELHTSGIPSSIRRVHGRQSQNCDQPVSSRLAARRPTRKWSFAVPMHRARIAPRPESTRMGASVLAARP